MSVTVDFVAFDDERDACVLVLVERGPWAAPMDEHLRALQDRLYECLDAALDGEVARSFPKAANKNIIIRVDCYGVPKDEIDDFVGRFAEGVRTAPDYQPRSSKWVRAFDFEVTHDQIH